VRVRVIVYYSPYPPLTPSPSPPPTPHPPSPSPSSTLTPPNYLIEQTIKVASLIQFDL